MRFVGDGALGAVLARQVGLTGEQLKFLPKTSLTEHLQVSLGRRRCPSCPFMLPFQNRLPPLSSVS